MSKRWLDGLSILGLVISLTAVCDMLGRFDLAALKGLYLVWGVACLVAMGLALLSTKARTHFHETCRGGSRLLGLRLAISAALLLLGWYVNAASANLYGADSVMVEDNGFRMLAVMLTTVTHVLYFAFTRRKIDAPTLKK